MPPSFCFLHGPVNFALAYVVLFCFPLLLLLPLLVQDRPVRCSSFGLLLGLMVRATSVLLTNKVRSTLIGLVG